MSERITRRDFLRDTTTTTVGLAVATEAIAADSPPATSASANAFASRWEHAPDRVWLGAEYWANPLQDWRLEGGRIECIRAAPDRNVHLLTRQLGEGPGDLSLSVRVGRVGGAISEGRGSFG